VENPKRLLDFSGRKLSDRRQNRRNSLFFPCLSGNLMPETGSRETASSAKQSGIFGFSAGKSENTAHARAFFSD
jgi:hypothetical protein